jgi:hypothetical protein
LSAGIVREDVQNDVLAAAIGVVEEPSDKVCADAVPLKVGMELDAR